MYSRQIKVQCLHELPMNVLNKVQTNQEQIGIARQNIRL